MIGYVVYSLVAALCLSLSSVALLDAGWMVVAGAYMVGGFAGFVTYLMIAITGTNPAVPRMPAGRQWEREF